MQRKQRQSVQCRGGITRSRGEEEWKKETKRNRKIVVISADNKVINPFKYLKQ